MTVQQNKVIADTVNSVSLMLGYSGYARLSRTTWHGTNIRPSFNRLYLIERGEGFLKYDGKTVLMKPGMAYLIPAGLSYSYGTASDMCKLFFHFNLMQPDCYDMLHDTGKVLEIPFPEDSLRRMIVHYRGNGYFDGIAVKRYIYRLLDDFCEAYGLTGKKLPAFSNHVLDTIDYIHNNLSAALRIEDLAGRLFVSRSYLAGRFRKEVGVPLGRCIDDQLMFAAQWRLDQTDDSTRRSVRSWASATSFTFPAASESSAASLLKNTGRICAPNQM